MHHSHPYLVNGRREAGLSPLDRGIAYGDGVFRTFPAYSGHPHCWSRQFRRLESDCNALGIVCPSEDILLDDITTLLSDDEDAAIKIIVTRGESERGYAVPPLAQPTRIVIKMAFPHYAESHFEEGVNLFLCETRLARQPRLAGIKHLNRLETVLARMEWVDPTIADGLMLDEGGEVIECCTGNVFARYSNMLYTPDLSRCGVAGVTRERILEKSGSLGLSAKIKHLRLPDLLSADEVIICNSLYGAWHVRSLASHSWPSGVLAARLRNMLREDDAPAV